VRDIVRAYRLVMQKGEPGGVYNVCRGESVLIADVLQRLMALAGVDVPVVIDPERVRPVDLFEQVGDPGRLVRLTGWQPVVTLDESLKEVLAAAA